MEKTWKSTLCSSKFLPEQRQTQDIVAFFISYFSKKFIMFLFCSFLFSFFSFLFFFFSDAKKRKSSCCENDDFPLGKFDVFGLGEQGLRMVHLKATSAFVFFMFSFFPLLCLFFFLLFLSKNMHRQHQDPSLTLDVSSSVGGSLEMRCPDNKMRDGSVWVGPPTWEKT